VRKILSYKDYLAEAEKNIMSDSSTVSMVASEINRNYSKFVMPDREQDNIVFMQEKRSWPVFLNLQTQEEEKESKCTYYIQVAIDNQEYELEVHFIVKYKGQPEFDNNNPNDYDKESTDFAVSLEDLKITRVALKSAGMKFDETTLLPDLKKNILGMLLTILRPEFDVIADEELIIRQL